MQALAFDIMAVDQSKAAFESVRRGGTDAFRGIEREAARLRREFDQDAWAAERFANKLAGVDRAVRSNAMSMGEAERVIGGMTQKLGVMANAEQLAARGQDELARAVRGANAALEAQNRAVARARLGVNDNFASTNLTYQLQDIAVSSVMGASPVSIALAQGSQIAMAFGDQGAGGAVRTLGAALGGLLNPISLVSVALTGAAAYAIQYFSDVGKGTAEANSALAAHGDLISRLRDRYGEAASGLQAYTKESAVILQADLNRSIEQYRDIVRDSSQAALDAVLSVPASDIGTQSPLFRQLTDAVDALQASIERGDPQFKRFIERIAGFEVSPYVTDSQKELFRSIRDSETAAAGLQAERALGGLGTLFDGTGDAARRGAQGIDAYTAAIQKLATIAAPPLSNADQALEAYRRAMADAEGPYARQAAARAYDAALERDATSRMPVPRLRGVDDIPAIPDPTDPWQELRKADRDAMKAVKDSISEADKAVLENRRNFRGLAGDIAEAIAKGEKLGDVLRKALSNLGGRLLDRSLDQLAEAFFPTSKDPGGSLGPWGVFGALFGRGGAANDNFRAVANDNFAAPVLPVERRPLGPVSMAVSRDAIASIESAGSGDYAAIGPTHPTLGRALGRYQVVEANVGPWSKAALGRTLTPGEFLANPRYQDAVFDHRFGGYLDRFGPRGAAQAWFGGPGSVGKLGRSDVLGTTVGGYGDKYMAAVERLSGAAGKSASALDGVTTGALDAGKGLGGLAQGLGQIVSGVSGGQGWGLGNLFGLGLSNTGSGFVDGRGGGLAGMLGYSPSGGGLGGMIGGAFSLIPKLFGFAGGTDFAPGGWSIVGERGPELMNVPRGAQILSNERSRRMMAEAGREDGGGAIDVHVVSRFDADGGFQTATEKVVRRTAPRIARQEASMTVGRYDYGQRMGGRSAADHSYSRLKRRS